MCNSALQRFRHEGCEHRGLFLYANDVSRWRDEGLGGASASAADVENGKFRGVP